MDPRRCGELRRPELDFIPGCSSGVRGPLARSSRHLLAIQSAQGLVPGFVSGSALIHQGRPLSQPLRAQGLCEVAVLVPEGHVEDIRQFAQELRDRQPIGPAPETPKWRAISPSAELMVSPDCSARGSVRDTRAPGADRFRWTVAVLGQWDPIAEGRTETRLEARSLAEAAVATYFAGRMQHADE